MSGFFFAESFQCKVSTLFFPLILLKLKDFVLPFSLLNCTIHTYHSSISSIVVCIFSDVSKNPDMFRSDTKGLPLLLILGYSNGVQIWNITVSCEHCRPFIEDVCQAFLLFQIMIQWILDKKTTFGTWKRNLNIQVVSLSSLKALKTSPKIGNCFIYMVNR